MRGRSGIGLGTPIAAMAVVGALVFGLSTAENAHAQPQPAQVAAASAEADKLFADGKAALEKREFTKARDLFEKALAKKRSTEIVAHLAATEMQLNRYREAAEHLDLFLREASDATPEDRQYAQGLLDDCKKKIGTATVQLSVSDAQVTLDGKAVAPTALTGTIYVNPGRRVFEAKAQGYKSTRQEIDFAAGTTRTVALMLIKDAPPPPAGTGKTPPATTGSAQPPPAGTGSAPPASTETPPPPPPSGSATGPTEAPKDEPGRGGGRLTSRDKYIMIGGGAGMVVGLGLGITFMLLSNSAFEDAQTKDKAIGAGGCVKPTGSRVAECDALKSSIGTVDTYKGVAVGGFIGAAAFLTATSAYTIWAAAIRKPAAGAAPDAGPKTEEKPKVSVIPVVSPQLGGFSVSGQF